MSEGTFESDAGDVDGHTTAPVTDDGELEAAGQGGPTQAGGPEQDDTDMKTDGGA
jgi:hypothetical protein